MLEAITFNLVALVAAITWALAIQPRPLSLAPLVVFLLQIVVIQGWVLATGLAGHLTVTAGWIVAGGLSGFVLVLWGWPNSTIRREGRRWHRAALQTWRSLGAWRMFGFGLVTLGMLGWLGAIGFLVGPYIPDVTAYHLVPATDWITRAAITPQLWPDPRSWWPQGHGLLAAWWMLPIGHFHAAVWAELHWVVLIWAAMWALVRELGGSRAAAAGAITLTAAVPIVSAQAVSGLNDLAVTALVLAALAPAMARRRHAHHAALAALAVVLGLATKPTMFVLAVPIALLVGFRRFVGRGRSARLAPESKAVSAGAITAALLVGVTVAAYWYFTAARTWNNPLYPAGLTIAGREWLQGHPRITSQVGHAGFEQMATNTWDLLTERIWDQRPIVTGQTERGTGFGLLASVLGLPALLIVAVRQRRARPFVITTVALVLVLAAAVQNDQWIGRFFSFVPLASLVAIVVITSWLRTRPVRLIVALVVLALAGWSVRTSVLATVPPIARTWFTQQGLTPVPARLLDFTDGAYLIDSAAEVPADETIVLVHGDFYGPVARYHGPKISRPLIYYNDWPGPYEVKNWKLEGLRWVLVAVPFSQLPQVDAAMESRGLIRVAEGLYVIP